MTLTPVAVIRIVGAGEIKRKDFSATVTVEFGF